MKSTPEKYSFKEFAKGLFSHLVTLLATIVGLGTVLAAVVAVSVATATPSHTPTPPAGHVSYNAQPGTVTTPNVATLGVTEANNVAYVTWSDPGAVGVSKVTINITVGNTCHPGVNYFYQHKSLTYAPARNADGATYQTILGLKNHGNVYWQYAPGNPYSAFITVTNSAGTSQPSACVTFNAPQTDPM